MGQVRRPASRTDRLSGAPCGQHGRARRCRGLKSGRQEHHGPLRVRLRDAHRIERARDRTHIRAGGLRLLERAGLAARPVDRHAQHVAVRDQRHGLVARDLDGLVDILLGTDAHRAPGTGNELDLRGQGGA